MNIYFTFIKIFFASAMILCFSSCSVGSDGASNPNATSKEFAEPTGTLLTSNISSIVIAGIYNADTISFRDPESLFPDADFGHCKFEGDPESIIDWACAYRNIPDCVARGQTKVTDNADFEFTQVEYQDVSIECTGAIKTSAKIIDGQINTSRENPNVFCSHFHSDKDGIEKDCNACKNSSGETSVRFDNGTYVVGTYILDPLCTELTTTIRDKITTRNVHCDITNFTAPCGTLASIQTINHCASF